MTETANRTEAGGELKAGLRDRHVTMISIAGVIGAGLFIGSVTGFTTFVSHAGGPPAAVFLLTRGLTKTQFQATTVLIFCVFNLIKFFPYAALGMFTSQTFTANLLLAPFALLGTWAGVRAHHVVPEKLFFGITYALLLITGTKLIWDGLT